MRAGTLTGSSSSHCRAGWATLESPVCARANRPTASGRTALSGRARRSHTPDMDETTRQCPYCELRFEYHGEIKDHIMRDHPERADVVRDIDPYELPHA